MGSLRPSHRALLEAAWQRYYSSLSRGVRVFIYSLLLKGGCRSPSYVLPAVVALTMWRATQVWEPESFS